MKNPGQVFKEERKTEIARMAEDASLRNLSAQWLEATARQRYSYNFTWLGRPVIQYPQDLMALQEIVWETKPDIIIETGIAHGGSLIFYASLLELLGGDRKVVGVDIDIRQHNRKEIEDHFLFKRIELLEGSSIDRNIVDQVYDLAKDKKSVMVVLDSMHTHDHVYKELQLYAPLVKKGNYLVVLDTIIEFLPGDIYSDRPWGPGDNPSTAVKQFLGEQSRFVVDQQLINKLQITVSPDGYLKCIE